MSPASCRCAGGGRPGARFAQGLAHRHRGPDAVAALRSDPEEARRIGREAADQVRVGRRIVIVVACSMWWMPSAISRSSGCPLCGWVGSAARTGASNRASAPGSAAPRRPAWRPGRPRRLRCQAEVVHVSAVRRRSPSSPDLARDRGDGPLQVQGAVAPPPDSPLPRGAAQRTAPRLQRAAPYGSGRLDLSCPIPIRAAPKLGPAGRYTDERASAGERRATPLI